MRLFNEISPMARYFGMKLSFTEEGNAVVDLPYNPNLDNLQRLIHGGVFATLLDIAGGFTAALAHEERCFVATTEMSIHYLASARQTSLRAMGSILKSGKRQKVAEMRLYDGKNRLVAHASGTFVVRPAPPVE
jgi:uncharacterized protein (TIGR00369 family)